MAGWLEQEVLEEDERREVEKELRILWLLWAGNFGMLPVLLVMCLVFGDKMRENMKGEAPVDLLMTVFLIVGLLSLVLAHFLRKRFLSGKLTFGQRPGRTDRAGLARQSFAIRFRSGIFLPMVIPASIGIYGFLLFILGAETWIFYLFLVISAAGLVYHRPNKYEFIDWVQKEKQLTD
jgi:hypothetical protein